MAKSKLANLRYKDTQILNLLQKNPEGLRATTINKFLNYKGRTLYNHLRSLEKKGLIVNFYPLWKIGKVQTDPKIWQSALNSDKEQGHNLLFILPLINKPDWWNKRKDRLIKLKDWHYKKEITANNNIYHQIENDSMQVQLYKNSIYFICKQRYYSNTPMEVFLKAKDDVLEAIRFLEEKFRFKLLAEGNEHLTVQDGHYLTYQDALSEFCEKINDRFKIKTKEGYEIWVDFSDPHGTESNNPEVKRRYLLDIKDRQDNPQTPVASEIWGISSQNALQLNKTLEAIQIQHELISGLPAVLGQLKEQISSHLSLIQEYRKENINWRKETVKKFRRTSEQRRLTEFGL
jgi:DNA-binding Lrp family transcriptional regulator